MRRIPLLLAATACMALGGGCGGDEAAEERTITIDIGEGPVESGEPPQLPGDDACPGAREPTTADNLRAAEEAVRCLTNAVRQDRGLAALERDDRLSAAAIERSEAMAEANYFGHEGPGDSNVRSAARAVGWVPANQSWSLGENIGWAEGDATPATMVRSWLDSPSHRRNLLAEHHTQIGVGAVAAVPREDAEPGATFTQIFGAVGEAAREAQGHEP